MPDGCRPAFSWRSQAVHGESLQDSSKRNRLRICSQSSQLPSLNGAQCSKLSQGALTYNFCCDKPMSHMTGRSSLVLSKRLFLRKCIFQNNCYNFTLCTPEIQQRQHDVQLRKLDNCTLMCVCDVANLNGLLKVKMKFSGQTKWWVYYLSFWFGDNFSHLNIAISEYFKFCHTVSLWDWHQDISSCLSPVLA